ncbi:MAG: hypothetical protein H6811_10665 [Phycisphaeraceae bacterium]|nr:hypothetical protein [Phycisphaeraceae bacterium]
MPRLCRAACVIATAALTLPAGAQSADLAARVPARTIFYAEIPSARAVGEALARADILPLLESEEVDALFRAFADSSQGWSLRDALAQVHLELDDLHWPTGPASMAIISPLDPEAAARAMEAGSDLPPPAFVVSADFGEYADAVEDAIDAIVDEGLDRKILSLERADPVNDVRIHVVSSIVFERRRAANKAFEDEYEQRMLAAETDEQWDALWEWYSANSPEVEDDPDALSAALASFPALAYARSGDVITVASSAEALADALLGPRTGESLADQPAFRNALKNTHESPHIRVVLNLAAMHEMSAASAAADPDAFVGWFGGVSSEVLSALGLDAMQSLGVTAQIDAPGGLLETRMHLHLPASDGLLSVFTPSAEPYSPPSFIPQSASDITRIRIDPRRLIDIARDAVDSLPEEIRDQARAQFNQFVFVARPILDSFVGDLHVWSMPIKAADLDPEEWWAPASQTCYAARVSDPVPLSNLLGAFGTQMGLTAREFVGGQIFAPGDQSMLPVAIGIGHGWAIVGPTSHVEDVLRIAANPAPVVGQPANDGFARAMEGLDSRAPVIAYVNMRSYLDGLRTSLERTPEDYRPDWFASLPSTEFLIRWLGDSANVIRITPDGADAVSLIRRSIED